MSDILRAKLSAVRRKSVMITAGAGAFLAVTVLIGAIGLEMAADWQWELSLTSRCAWLSLTLSTVLLICIRKIVWPLVHLPQEDEVALWIEHESPGLGSRLIASIQLTREQAVPTGQSLSLVRALVRQTEQITAPMDFMGVVKLDRFARLGAVASLMIVLGCLTMDMGGTASVDLLKRALLVPGVSVPRKTRVQMLTPDPLVIAVGDSVELRALAAGIIPSSGSVAIHYDGESDRITLPMPADPAAAKQFFTKLETVSRSFTYRVTLNDGHGIDGRVEAGTRPSVASMQIAEIFPAYTHLASIRHSPSDLRILAGSRLAIRIKTNKPIKNTIAADRPYNRISLQGKGGTVEVPLLVDGDDRQTLVGSDSGNPDIALPADVQGLSIHLVDENGLQTQDPAVYPIQIIPDAPPTLRVTYPDRKEQLSTVQARLLIGVEASDDFALGKLILHYRILPPASTDAPANTTAGTSVPGETKPGPINSIDLDLQGTPHSFRGQFHFELSDLKIMPLEHGAVEWWLEAQDTNDVTGPGKTRTDHYVDRIGSEAEVRSDLFARLGNHMGEIKEAAETQKQNNADLGQMIQQKAAPDPTQQ